MNSDEGYLNCFSPLTVFLEVVGIQKLLSDLFISCRVSNCTSTVVLAVLSFGVRKRQALKGHPKGLPRRDEAVMGCNCPHLLKRGHGSRFKGARFTPSHTPFPLRHSQTGM